MNIELLYKPESTVAHVHLEEGESIIAESGAMLCMSKNMTMETKTDHSEDGKKSGMLSKVAKVGKRMMSGESLYQNKFTATGGPGDIMLSQPLPGDSTVIDIPDSGIYLQSSAYIACTPGATVTGKFGGVKSFFGLGGLFILQATATTPGEKLFFGCFGGLHEMECDGTMTVDNGHLVAWEGTLSYTTQKACDGIIASYFSGEGLVCNFTGHGKIWVQTRQPTGFGQALSRYLDAI